MGGGFPRCKLSLNMYGFVLHYRSFPPADAQQGYFISSSTRGFNIIFTTKFHNPVWYGKLIIISISHMTNVKGLDWPGVECIYFTVSSNSSSAQHRVEMCVNQRRDGSWERSHEGRSHCWYSINKCDSKVIQCPRNQIIEEMYFFLKCIQLVSGLINSSPWFLEM